jgi:acetyltransferase-like isoleucine patch superfamily enzyme
MINILDRYLKHENLSYAPIALTRWVLEQISGRLHAYFLGWPKSYLGPGSRVIGTRHISVGERTYINRYAWIEAVHTFRGQEFQPTVNIGRGFAASDRLHISCNNRIDIGDDCLFGSGVYIGDHNHGSYKGHVQSFTSLAPSDRELSKGGRVVIGSNVWLGDNVVIVGEVCIGDGAVIGANSVVTKDVASNVMAAGNPIKVLKIFDASSQTWVRPAYLLASENHA